MGEEQRVNVTHGWHARDVYPRQGFREVITSPSSGETLCVSSLTSENPRRWDALRGETDRPGDQHKVSAAVGSYTWRERRGDRLLPVAGTSLRVRRGDGNSAPTGTRVDLLRWVGYYVSSSPTAYHFIQRSDALGIVVCNPNQSYL